MSASAAPAPQTPRFLWLFALAWAGGAVAYVPFLTILLPLRVVTMSGGDGVRLLGLITFCGAIAASIGGILFGWLSDRSRSRRPWIAGGLAISAAILVAMPMAKSAGAILAFVVAWQLALNMMLGPLSAWAADHVPPEQTGFLGGLMALSPALGALSGVIVTIPRLANADQRLWLVALMVIACVSPALLLLRPKAGSAQTAIAAPHPARRDAIAMWIARLLVQVAEAALFAYLLLYFRSLDRAVAESDIARLFSVVLAIAFPIALVVGRYADRSARPARPLAFCALIAGLGLTAMAEANSLQQATMAYVLFGLSTTVFLALHSGQTLRVLPNPGHRGRDLGLFNLTNTVPSLIMPWLTIAIVPTRGFATLFGVLAVLSLAASAILFALKKFD